MKTNTYNRTKRLTPNTAWRVAEVMSLIWAGYLPRVVFTVMGEPEVTEWQVRVVFDLTRFGLW